MIDRQPLTFAAYLLQDDEKISIEARYASKFSLLIRFLNGYDADPGSAFQKIIFNQHGEDIEIGPCRYITAPDKNGYQGRLVFSHDVYDLQALFFDNKLEKLQAELFHLPLILARKDDIKDRFREYTANLTYDLNVYKNLFDGLDAKLAVEPEVTRQHVQDAVISTEGRKFMAFLDEKRAELEDIIAAYRNKAHARHGYYLRRQLWNFITCAPLMTRTNLKPQGYSGDAVIMKMIYANKYEGSSIFGKLLHKHACESPAARALRRRPEFIAEILRRKTRADETTASKKIKVLAVACGPALEIQDVLMNADDCRNFQFTLLEQDESALAETAARLNRLEKKLGSKIEVEYLNQSIRTLPASPELNNLRGQYDYIYSMGLCDSLTAPAARAVLESLYHLLKTGGEMAIGNFHISNPSRFYMAYWLDWTPCHRTEDEFLDLLKSDRFAEKKVLFEDTGIDMFLMAQK